MVQVYPRHARKARICMKGSRRWFAAQGLDWDDFVTNGIPSERLRATNDPIVEQAVIEAEREAGER